MEQEGFVVNLAGKLTLADWDSTHGGAILVLEQLLTLPEMCTVVKFDLRSRPAHKKYVHILSERKSGADRVLGGTRAFRGAHDSATEHTASKKLSQEL